MLRDTEAEALPQATAREQATQVAMARQKGASGGGEAAENLKAQEAQGRDGQGRVVPVDMRGDAHSSTRRCT